MQPDLNNPYNIVSLTFDVGRFNDNNLILQIIGVVLQFLTLGIQTIQLMISSEVLNLCHLKIAVNSVEPPRIVVQISSE